MHESTIEIEVCKYAQEKRSIIAIKMNLFLRRGFPDRMFLASGGRIMFVEFKSPKGSLTAKQKYWFKILRNFGFRCEVCKSIEDGKNLIAQWVDE